MMIKKEKNKKQELTANHIYLIIAIKTVVISFITLYLIGDCIVSFIFFSVFINTLLMLVITNFINSWIEKQERKQENHNGCFTLLWELWGL